MCGRADVTRDRALDVADDVVGRRAGLLHQQGLLDHRIDVPGGTGNRNFPAYLDSNRFLSNLPGTTIFFPVVDLSRQYINGLMYLLTQPDELVHLDHHVAHLPLRPT